MNATEMRNSQNCRVSKKAETGKMNALKKQQDQQYDSEIILVKIF